MESTKVLSLDLRVKGITNVIFATQHDTGRLVKVLLSVRLKKIPHSYPLWNHILLVYSCYT